MNGEKPPLREMTAHNNLHAMLFQVTSAEYIALCVQAYQLARHALLARLEGGTFRNPAVIFDLDETVLDNSAYQVWQIGAGTNFHEASTWTEWCNEGAAGAVPGAIEFIEFVEQQQVTPIFITSRPNVTRAGTARNLAALGLVTEKELEAELAYNEEPDHALETRLFMKKMPTLVTPFPSGARTLVLENKFDQRVFVEQVRNHEIILSVGDNLGDYAEYYGRVTGVHGEPVYRTDNPKEKVHPDEAARRAAVLQDLRMIGRDFILIPNVTYGGWLRAFEANRRGAPDELVATGVQVRLPLDEPQGDFVACDGAKIRSEGRKFDQPAVIPWIGPSKQV